MQRRPIYGLLFTICALLSQKMLEAKVEAPNYNFSIETLENFGPGRTEADIAKTYGKGEVIDTNGPIEARQYWVSHVRYRFPVIVHYFNGQSIDMFARLPSYFGHDLFHQSLINRLGKQDEYTLKDRTAHYVWNDYKGVRHIYESACTITCFPQFYSTQVVSLPKGAEMAKSMLDKLLGGKI